VRPTPGIAPARSWSPEMEPVLRRARCPFHMYHGLSAAGSRVPPIHVGPPPIRGIPTVAKVYDLC
jgi:hypothetical protein